MKVNVLLADTGVEDATGKVHLLGLGWHVTAVLPNGLTPDFVVAVFLEVPWDKCNREIEISLELITDDGQVVTVPTPGGEQRLKITQKAVVTVPPGAPNGSSGQMNLLAKFQGGLPLAPGSWYAWRVSVDGQVDDSWTARFFVRRQPSTPTFGAVAG